MNDSNPSIEVTLVKVSISDQICSFRTTCQRHLPEVQVIHVTSITTSSNNSQFPLGCHFIHVEEYTHNGIYSFCKHVKSKELTKCAVSLFGLNWRNCKFAIIKRYESSFRMIMFCENHGRLRACLCDV